MTLPRRRPKERRKLDTRVKCPGHLKFVREEFECSIKGRVCKSTGERHECWGPIDAHHVRTRGAGGGDEQVVSLCRGAHSLLDSWGWSAKRVYCIEANPMWSWIFASMLIEKKLRNVSYLFGSADEFVGCIKADVAIFCTHSGVQPLRLVAGQFAPEVIDVYGEIIKAAPQHFNQMLREFRDVI